MAIADALRALDRASHWQARAPYLKAWREAGIHTGETLPQMLARCAADHPDIKMVFGSLERPSQTTAGASWDASLEVAVGLHKLGLKEGDPVVVQMPNWDEGVLAMLACFRLGLIVVPMIHTYGPGETAYILERTEAVAMIVPDRWKKIDYDARLAGIATPFLRHVIVAGDAPFGRPVTRWHELLGDTTTPLPELSAGPDDACLINFTSGTTSAPKGVVHSHHSLASEIPRFPFVLSPNGRSKLMPLPGGHIAGVIANLSPLLAADPVILMDAWDNDLAKALIVEHRPDRAGGVPFMVAVLAEEAATLFPDGVVQMSIGAASVPPSLMERCEAMGWPGTRTYGSTEHPTISGAFPADPFAKRVATDGRLLEGVQVRLVDDETGQVVGVGQPGEIVSMGPELCKGYLEPAHNEAAFAADGWFHTGDIGVMDAEGYLAIVDRKKDIIIRGGENISS
ncbi:MAG: fatty-acyl-CoA synthase, partial [Caulobacteraceae bacterium]|nr:fatty-acyl-CoA synthase [Caulobacteraceae bacterium]